MIGKFSVLFGKQRLGTVGQRLFRVLVYLDVDAVGAGRHTGQGTGRNQVGPPGRVAGINDDRQNPKIRLTPVRANIFAPGGDAFIRGAVQLITATWGYVESDDSTPQPIKDTIIQLVIRDSAGYFDQIFGGDAPSNAMPVQREKTDDHEIEYARMNMNMGSDRLGQLIPRDMRAVLAMYRHPLIVAAPEPPRFIPFDRAFAIEAF